MKKLFHITGVAASLLALTTLLGGHWMVLQSVAWTRMFVNFSAQGSMVSAVKKTFDGKHRCSMCMQIEQGRQAEEQQQKEAPGTPSDKMPDLFAESNHSLLPEVPETPDMVFHSLDFFISFISTPPVPPPRELPTVS